MTQTGRDTNTVRGDRPPVEVGTVPEAQGGTVDDSRLRVGCSPLEAFKLVFDDIF